MQATYRMHIGVFPEGLLKNILFFQIGKINRKPAPKKKRKYLGGLKRGRKVELLLLPDLMAEMIANAPKIAPPVDPQPFQEAIIEKPVQEAAPEKKVWFAPKQNKIEKWERPPAREVIRVPVLPEKEPDKIQRFPGVYTNIPSPYGIWTEMAAEQLKKSG